MGTIHVQFTPPLELVKSMRKRAVRLLGIVLLVAGLAGARSVMQPKLDSRFVGKWNCDDPVVDFMSKGPAWVTHTFSSDGTWSTDEWAGCGFFWSPRPQKTWFVHDGELVARTTFPIWSSDGDLRNNFTYAWARISDAARGKAPLIVSDDERFQIETAPDGEITLVAIVPESTDLPRRYRKGER